MIHPHPTRDRRTRAHRILVGALTPALFFCAGLATARASAPLPSRDLALDTRVANVPAPADPSAIDAPAGTPSMAAYDYDPAFAAHGFGIDRFSDVAAKQYYGRKIARLDNGDIIVAGLVPKFDASTSDQLGLVRYTAAGRRVAWTSVDPAWTRYNNEYIVYPNGSGGQPTGAFVSVVGLQAHDGNLYVMANEQSADGAVHPIVMVFAQSGFFRGWWSYFPGGGNQKPGTAFTISGSKLTVVGADPNPSDLPGLPQMWMSRYTITDGGGLGVDQNFGTDGIATYRAEACQVAATAYPCHTFPAAIASPAGTTLPVNPKFYVVATAKGSGHANYGTVVMRFNGDGSRDTTFGFNTSLGYDTAEVGFHDGGDQADWAVAIEAGYHLTIPIAVVEDLYVVSKVSRATQSGIGVFRLDGSGAVVTGFGEGGKVLFGGCGAGGGNCEFSNVEEVPLATALSGGHLAIAGWYQGFAGTEHLYTYPMFAMVNAGSGAVENLGDYTVYIGDAVFYDVVADGDGTFTMAGDARETATGNNVAYLVAKLQPHDFIFRNGVD